MINESWVGQRLSAYSGGSASSAQPEPPSMAPYIGGLRGGAAQKGVASSGSVGSSSCVAAGCTSRLIDNSFHPWR